MEARIVEALLRSHVAGVALFDQSLRCVQVNAELTRLASTTPDQLIGKPLDEIMAGARRDELSVIAQVLATGKPALARTIDGPNLSLRADYLPLRDDADHPVGVVIVAVDLTPQRRAEEALSQRLRVAELLSEISARLIDVDARDLDRAIDVALARIGEGLGIDGAHVSELNDDKTQLSITHEWLRAGRPAVKGDFQQFPVAKLAWTASRVLAGELSVIHALDELPPDGQAERVLYQARGAKSVVVVPLHAGKQVAGVVTFVQASHERHWTPEMLSSLRLLSEIVGSALHSQRTHSALREQLAFEQAAAELASRFINASVDAIDGAITDSLRLLGEALRYERTAVFLIENDYMELTHEWCAPGVNSFRASMTGLRIAQFGWPLTAVAAGEPVNLDRRTLPPDAVNARRVLERDGMETLSTVPMLIEEKVVGSVGFHARKGRALSETVLARMQLVAGIISAAIARKRSELSRRQAWAELERLKTRAERERDYLREEASGHKTIIGDSPVLKRLLETVDVVAATGATVLIRGESGVGKELFARAIHERSPRRNGPLVKVNCASVPKELFESEFFGHVRGAFTGAFKDRAGRFELADGGTLFLDEVGDIPLDLQAKLLRVLQESEFERVGDDRTRKVDVRIVAATNRNLEADVVAGRFRQDLYYRLSVFPLEVPPLRARKPDVVPLAEHFLRASATKLGRSDLELDEAQRRLLIAYDWPGNVRELQHVIERAVILSPTPPLQLDRALQVAAPALAPTVTTPAAAPATPPGILKEQDLRALERESIVAALERAAGRIAGPGGAAELLGIRPSTLRDRMKALGIQRPA